MSIDPSLQTNTQTQPHAPAMPVQAPRKSRIARVLRFVGRGSLMLLVVAAISAAVLMGLSYHFSDGSAGSMVVQMDGLTVHEAVATGVLKTGLLWLACTAGLLIAFGALLLAAFVTLGALLFASATVCLVGLVLAAPFLLMCALLFWVLRKLFGASAQPVAAPGAPI